MQNAEIGSQWLAEEVEMEAAGAGGVFGERFGCGIGWSIRGFGAVLVFPEAAAVGVAFGRLGIFFGLADAGGVFGLLGGIHCSGVLGGFALGFFSFGGALWKGCGGQAAGDSE